LHQRAGNHRKSADNGRLVVEPALRAQPRDRGAKSVDHGHAARRRQQVRQPGKGALACCAQIGADMGLVRHAPSGAAPKPRGDTLETRLAGEVADEVARDDQLAALAIDMAQHGFGGGHAVQTNLALGEVDVHGRISCSIGITSADSTD
jgi:hypothetical protein